MKINGIEKRFVKKEEMPILAQKWRSRTKVHEPAKNNSYFPYRYNNKKEEGFGAGRNETKIEKFHDESIIKKTIPELLGKLPKGQKLKILDNGAGAGIFVDQIREKFGDRVEVYSTGLSKQAARKLRIQKNLPRLNKNDLKWRSIQELSDFEEFHLIIDTYGEQYYRSGQYIQGLYLNQYSTFNLNNIAEFLEHINQVVRKLLPGGYAMLYPVCFSSENQRIQIINMLKKKFGIIIHKTKMFNLKFEKPIAIK